MLVVIQCASGKTADAEYLHDQNQIPVSFVAQPDLAPAEKGLRFARPDDPAGDGKTWRDVLLRYNQAVPQNPQGLLPAYQLYQHPVYARLVDRFGLEKIYILSAGWGLILGTFLTPYYDITFSPRAEKYKRRHKKDDYRDFNQLPADTNEKIVFFGGKDYVPLFARLTSNYPGERTIFFNSATRPAVSNCDLIRFETRTRTNWHYECANAFIDGAI